MSVADSRPQDGDGSPDQLDPAADKWLVDKARAGNTDAYEALIRRHRDRIYRIALSMLGNREDAEDITQDVVIQVWVALSGFTGSSTFTTWLYRIVVNRCINLSRRRKRTVPLLDTDPTPVPGAEDDAIARHRAAAALAAVAALPEELRLVLVLREMEELSTREVAAITNLPETTIRGRLSRARTQLFTQLRSWS